MTSETSTETAPVPRETATWAHFVHGADIGIEGRAPTLAATFEQAALALTAVIVDPSLVAPVERLAITCEAPDPELLLVDWLNALIYEMATHRMLFSRYEVSVTGGRLAGNVWGEPIDLSRHCPAVEVKGATYTQLSVTRGEDGLWTARCVVDV